MKRIALYIPDLRRGGAERAVSKFSEILRFDYQVDIILHKPIVEYPVYGNIVDLGAEATDGFVGKLKINLKRIHRLKKLKKANRYACVISFLNNANIVNILSCTRYTRVAVSVRNYYEADIYNGITHLTTGMLDILYHFADRIVPVTRQLEGILKNKGIPQDKIITLYNPFDVNAIRNKMEEEVLTEEEMSFLKGRFVFTYVGRLSRQKGIWNLLKAFRRLLDRSDVGLFIVGSGEQYSKIKEYIHQYEMSNIMVVGQKENPFSYIHRTGSFILPSLAEGFPNVIGEALACGAAIIATDCKTGPREILAPDVSLEQSLPELYEAQYGLLIAPMSGEEEWDCFTDDDKRIYCSICRFLDNKEMVQRYRTSAVKRALDFSYESARITMKTIIEGK